MNTQSLLPLFDIVQALRQYYDQLRQEPLTETEFEACLATLPPHLRDCYARRGRATSLLSLIFREYCLDCRGCTRASFLRVHLPPDCFARWQVNVDFWDLWFEFCEATEFAAF